jgi:hypothetical protein
VQYHSALMERVGSVAIVRTDSREAARCYSQSDVIISQLLYCSCSLLVVVLLDRHRRSGVSCVRIRYPESGNPGGMAFEVLSFLPHSNFGVRAYVRTILILLSRSGGWLAGDLLSVIPRPATLFRRRQGAL